MLYGARPKVGDRAQDPIVYDYIIVGAGFRRLRARQRLSADRNVRGCARAGRAMASVLHMPAGIASCRHKGMNWNYTTEPDRTSQPRLGGRAGAYRGSSSINRCATPRAIGDYDAWAADGKTGWDFASMLQYFRVENQSVEIEWHARWHAKSADCPPQSARDVFWPAPEQAGLAARRFQPDAKCFAGTR